MSAHSGLATGQNPLHLSGTKANKPLPTDRVSPQNHMKILKAWAFHCQDGTKAVTVNEIAFTVGMAASTVALTNPFFASIGLLQRLSVGTYIPSRDVLAFFNAKNQETATRNLAPAFRDAWFGRLILHKLKYAPIGQQALLAILEEECGAAQEQKKALEFLLDFMEAVGLIERNGEQVTISSWCSSPPQLIPTVKFDGSSYTVEVCVNSKQLAERLRTLFTSLAELIANE